MRRNAAVLLMYCMPCMRPKSVCEVCSHCQDAMMQDSDNQAAINRLFGVEQHTSLRNEESGESIEVSMRKKIKQQSAVDSLGGLAHLWSRAFSRQTFMDTCTVTRKGWQYYLQLVQVICRRKHSTLHTAAVTSASDGGLPGNILTFRRLISTYCGDRRTARCTR